MSESERKLQYVLKSMYRTGAFADTLLRSMAIDLLLECGREPEAMRMQRTGDWELCMEDGELWVAPSFHGDYN